MARTHTDSIVRRLNDDLATLIGCYQQEIQSLRTELAVNQAAVLQSTVQVQDMCTTVRNALQLSVTRQEACNRSFLDALEKFSSAQDENNRWNKEMMLRLLQQLQHQPNNQQSIMMEDRPIDNLAAVDGAGAVALADHLGGLPEDAAEEDYRDPSFATIQARRGRRLGLNPIEMLLTTPRKPAVDPEFPTSWMRLVIEWQTNDLESFVRVKTSRWDDKKLVSRYTKRLRGIRVLRRYIESVGNNIDDREAASRLDNERIDRVLTLSSHMMILFQHDNAVTRRVRVAGTNNNNNI